MNDNSLTAYFQAQQGAMLQALQHLVEHESPSADKARLDALARELQARFEAVGARALLRENAVQGNHVEVTYPRESATPGKADVAPALLLCHFDTVWPVGTLAQRPLRVEDGKAIGPGTFDMKASLVIAESALRAIHELGLTLPRPVTLLLTSDEEIGSLSSRSLIENHARQAAYVLVLEPALLNGALKTARKGVGQFVMRITGKAAHAGVEPEKGVDAVEELAHQILALRGLANPVLGTTLNVGVVHGGSQPNVVAESAEALIDARAWTADEAQRVESAIFQAVPHLRGANIAVSGGFDRPPLERTPQVAGLFERVRALGAEIGLELQEGATGGGSDGNFTAALGVPTLDGLGARGDGAHAQHEHIVIESLAERATLLTHLLLHL